MSLHNVFSALFFAAVAFVAVSSAVAFAQIPTGGWMEASPALFPAVNPFMNKLINEELQNLAIPNYSYSEFIVHLNLSDMHVTSWVCNDCINVGISTNNSLQITGFDVAGSVHLHYDAHLSFIGSSGDCEVDLSGVNIVGYISVTENNNGAPQLYVENVDLSIGNYNFNCSGAAGKVVELLERVFTGTVKDLIQYEATQEIRYKIDTTVNYILGNLTLDFALPGGYAAVAFDLSGAPIIGPNHGVFVPVAAVVVPENNASIVFPFPQPPRASPNNPCTTSMVSVGLTFYSIETAIYSFFIGGQLTNTWPAAITSSDVSLAIPGFAQKLGKNAGLNVTLSATGYGTVSAAQPNGVQVFLPVDISIIGADNTEYVLSVLIDVAISVSVHGTSSDQPRIALHVDNATLTNPTVVASNVGGGFVPLLVAVLNGVMSDAVLPVVNAVLALGIPLPQIAGFSVTNAVIGWTTTGFCVGLDIIQ